MRGETIKIIHVITCFPFLKASVWIRQVSCHIADKYKKVINILTCNFSKEQLTLPEDDLRFETCRSIFECFNVKILDYYNITVHLLLCNKLSKLYLICLNSNNRLLFIMEIRFVYYEVENLISKNYLIK